MIGEAFVLYELCPKYRRCSRFSMCCSITMSEYPHFVLRRAECFTWLVEHVIWCVHCSVCVHVRMVQTSYLSCVGVPDVVDCGALKTGWAVNFVDISGK